jgi:hypothetical protein
MIRKNFGRSDGAAYPWYSQDAGLFRRLLPVIWRPSVLLCACWVELLVGVNKGSLSNPIPGCSETTPRIASSIRSACRGCTKIISNVAHAFFSGITLESLGMLKPQAPFGRNDPDPCVVLIGDLTLSTFLNLPNFRWSPKFHAGTQLAYMYRTARTRHRGVSEDFTPNCVTKQKPCIRTKSPRPRVYGVDGTGLDHLRLDRIVRYSAYHHPMHLDQEPTEHLSLLDRQTQVY